MNAATRTLVVTLAEAASGDAVLPSVFELYLVDQLDALLKPAFRHVWSSLVNLLPMRMSALSDALFDRWQELYTIVLVAAQYHSIKEHHRTIAEGIYGLRRVNFTQQQSAAPPIDSTQQDISIALAAFMPSILDALGRVSASIRRRRQQRLARWGEHHGTALAEARAAAPVSAETELASGRVLVTPVRTLRPSPPAPTLLELLQEGAAIAFPFCRSALLLAELGQRMLYCFGASAFSHPLLALAGVGVVKGGVAHAAPAPAPAPAPAATKAAVKATAGAGAGFGAGAVDWRMALLLGCLVAVRVVAAAAAPDEGEGEGEGEGRMFPRSAAQTAAEADSSASVIPPPPKSPRLARGCVPPSDPLVCPVCLQPRRYPTAVPSGFVFCYSCLSDAVATGGCCPVSGEPCSMDDAVRLFIDAGRQVE